jgi:hypothetical protein
LQLMEDKVTIVVGAGASKEFGLPTGKELSGKIIALMETKDVFIRPTFSDYEFNRALEVSLTNGLMPGSFQEHLDY